MNDKSQTRSSILKVKNLSKTYKTKLAVNDVSFNVNQNEIIGLLGPNGAGKTSTINMILGVLEASSGEIEICNKNLRTQRTAALQETNFAAVYAALPGNLTVHENLKVFSLIYAIKDLNKKIDEVIAKFYLESLLKLKCGVLSSGEQTRVSLAKAFLNDPKLLLLDEPTASLDPSSAKELRKLIRDSATASNTAVLWTSHNMYEMEEVCDEVIFMSKGSILIKGKPKDLIAKYNLASLEELFINLAESPQV